MRREKEAMLGRQTRQRQHSQEGEESIAIEKRLHREVVEAR
jgi:hypothetical protein